jgi:hypothetical protein
MRKFLLATAAVTIVLSVPIKAQAQSGHVASQQTRFGIDGAGQKFAFTDEERMIMRRYIHTPTRSVVTTGAARSETVVAPGDRIPDGVALHPFPAAVYHEAPELGLYRFIRIGPSEYVVDPRDRTIVEEIN